MQEAMELEAKRKVEEEEALKRQQAEQRAKMEKLLEEEKKKLRKQVRDSQLEMDRLYDQAMKELEPTVKKMRKVIDKKLKPFYDIDTCIERIPSTLEEAVA